DSPTTSCRGPWRADKPGPSGFHLRGRDMKRSMLALAAAACLAGAPALAGETAIRIGVLNDQSGTYADFGGLTSVDAARMAVEDFGGNVLGKKIEILAADHQNKPDV